MLRWCSMSLFRSLRNVLLLCILQRWSPVWIFWSNGIAALLTFSGARYCSSVISINWCDDVLYALTRSNHITTTYNKLQVLEKPDVPLLWSVFYRYFRVCDTNTQRNILRSTLNMTRFSAKLIWMHQNYQNSTQSKNLVSVYQKDKLKKSLSVKCNY